MKTYIIGGISILAGAGAVLLGTGVVKSNVNPDLAETVVVIGALFCGFGLFVLLGESLGDALGFLAKLLEHVKVGKGGVDVVFRPEQPVPVKRRDTPADLDNRVDFAQTRQIPGHGAPEFNVLNVLKDMPGNSALPTASPMVPMYRLDKNFRIIEWNDAFNLAFDWSMEGMRGQSALEWVYFLENYKEVIQHGEAIFAVADTLPTIDVEKLVFKSENYGRLTATKRAYQIPDDDGDLGGWLVTLDPEFENDARARQYQHDLLNILSRHAMWSEYSVSYDAVLTNTRIYPELIDTMIGVVGDLGKIPADTRVLDLGAGTGNLALSLVNDPATPRLVYAVENNDAMLGALRSKCHGYLRNDDKGSGIIAIQQDITSLFGLPSNYFDFVIMNNVLYAVDQPAGCLAEAHRVLKPEGEIRISGPKEDSDIGKLFKRIRKDLKENGKFEAFEQEFRRVQWFNTYMLSSMFKSWNVSRVVELVEQAGFGEVGYTTDRAYAGQALIVAARK